MDNVHHHQTGWHGGGLGWDNRGERGGRHDYESTKAVATEGPTGPKCPPPPKKKTGFQSSHQMVSIGVTWVESELTNGFSSHNQTEVYLGMGKWGWSTVGAWRRAAGITRQPGLRRQHKKTQKDCHLEALPLRCAEVMGKAKHALCQILPYHIHDRDNRLSHYMRKTQ